MKKILLFVVIGVTVGGIGVGGYLAWRRTKSASQPEAVPSQVTPKETLLTWDDPNGFTFQYPDGLTVDKHDEDQMNYAHIEFTSKDHPGNVIVWGKDTTAADVAAWSKTEKRFTGANIIDSTLAGSPAKKVLLSTPSKMLIVGTVDDGIVWTVEANLTDESYWSGVHDTIAGSFALKPLNGASGSSGSGDNSSSVDTSGGDVSADAEETIQ